MTFTKKKKKEKELKKRENRAQICRFALGLKMINSYSDMLNQTFLTVLLRITIGNQELKQRMTFGSPSIVEPHVHGSSDKDGSSQRRERWSDSEYTLKAEP